MGEWKFGASAKEFGRLGDYAKNFDLLEIDLEKAVKLGFGPIENIVEKAMEFGDKTYSVHLRYKPFDSKHKDGIDASIDDLRFLCENGYTEKLGIKMFVTHPDYPSSSEMLKSQLARLDNIAKDYGVTIAVENLGDRKNKTRGSLGARNPKEIAQTLEDSDFYALGLCLDTGHAISNAGLTDSLNWGDLVPLWLKHVHYNDNMIRKDDHLPICQDTNKSIIANLKYLVEQSFYGGVIIFEHRKFEQAILSRDFVQSEEYGKISPDRME